jgi:hypothetical protein
MRLHFIPYAGRDWILMALRTATGVEEWTDSRIRCKGPFKNDAAALEEATLIEAEKAERTPQSTSAEDGWCGSERGIRRGGRGGFPVARGDAGQQHRQKWQRGQSGHDSS